jgi:predicted dehydrogenase
VEIAAVSDVDSEHLQNGMKELEALQESTSRAFKDYRDLLEMPGLEAVLIGTPTHWHALQFAYDLEEGKAMVEAARKAGNIVQIGFQRRQSNAYKKAKELIQDGTTGKIHQINAQIHYNPDKADTTRQDPPASLDWDMWCGPAPKLPYSPSVGHGSWRLEKEYGNSHLVDWGIHHIDIIRVIMDFDSPHTIRAKGSLEVLKGEITTPDSLIASLQYNDCPVIWQHRLWGAGEVDPRFNNGIFFYGENGSLFTSEQRLVWKPAGRNQQEQVMDIRTPDMQEKHLAEFIQAVKTGNKELISCTVEDGFLSTAAVQLAMISYETGSELMWDHKQKSITDNSNAKSLLARPYRNGYARPVV